MHPLAQGMKWKERRESLTVTPSLAPRASRVCDATKRGDRPGVRRRRRPPSSRLPELRLPAHRYGTRVGETGTTSRLFAAFAPLRPRRKETEREDPVPVPCLPAPPCSSRSCLLPPPSPPRGTGKERWRVAEKAGEERRKPSEPASDGRAAESWRERAVTGRRRGERDIQQMKGGGVAGNQSLTRQHRVQGWRETGHAQDITPAHRKAPQAGLEP
ncbi:uncharacterized protein LOC108939324 isoform X2 [Scleropages formosus]|uniref:uncharacterized protein LOC108939324 isoform X2 n=1 Tax=Scleropages formosus TaxID=113540 RepID=UPI00087831FD|nr:uncharacterized protein LOC108939324 isoform X2 [Scleropages formosus]